MVTFLLALSILSAPTPKDQPIKEVYLFRQDYEVQDPGLRNIAIPISNAMINYVKGLPVNDEGCSVEQWKKADQDIKSFGGGMNICDPPDHIKHMIKDVGIIDWSAR